MSWNILAPELLQVFWRSSYGLPLLEAGAYDRVTVERLRVIVEHVRACAPDVLLLQEVTDTAFACLGGHTTASFLAHATGLTLSTSSFKDSRFTYGTPPNEQPGRRGTETMDSGVATLYRASAVRHVASLGRAEDGGPCALFPAGVGSPFAIDAFLPVDGGDSPPLLVINVHVRMQFPRIAASVEDVVARVRTALSRGGLGGASRLDRVLLGGDLNAGGAESRQDLLALLAPDGALGRVGLVAVGSGAPCDDHFLAGRGLRVREVPRPEPPPLLAMGVGSAPVSDTRLWSVPGTAYTRSEANAERLGLTADSTARSSGRTAGSDHPPLLVEVE